MIMITNQTKQNSGLGLQSKTAELNDNKPIYTRIFATLYEELKSS